MSLEICVNKIRVMNNAYVSNKDMKHRNCDGYNETCPDYRPYKSNCEIPVRKGLRAYLLERKEFDLTKFGMGF